MYQMRCFCFFLRNFYDLHLFQWPNTFSFFLQGNDLKWSIYFNDLHLPVYDTLQYAYSIQLGFGNFELTHVDGDLFKLSPTAKFKGKLL